MPKKTLKGTIKAVSGPRTVRVEVVRTFHHPRYRKRVERSKSYLAHFEGEAEIGQPVVIEESRPVSKRKRWRVIEIAGEPAGRPESESPETAKPAVRRKKG